MSTTPKTPQFQPTPLTPLGDNVNLLQPSFISKYLTIPHLSSVSTKPAPRPQLLTSADAPAILEVKQSKKRGSRTNEGRKKEWEEKKSKGKRNRVREEAD